MPGEKKNRPAWVRFSSMGFEFAAAIIGFVLLGLWIGRHYGNGQLGVLIGAALGIVGGGYNLIRESLQAAKQANRPKREDDGDSE